MNNYPSITLNNCTYAQITQNKTGDLAMVYKPLQNFIKEGSLGGFSTKRLKFDRYTSQDILVVDEFDGSTNIIVNDDKNEPRLVNSGFAVQEDNTFLIPEHQTNTVNNIYNDDVFDQDTQLFKLYNKIPKLSFVGLSDGGSFQCGSYVFYFRLADSYGNMSNVIQHSSIVQVPVGQIGTQKLRMGMQDENAGKVVEFTLSQLDAGFDYVRVFYERTSTGNDQAQNTLFYMVDQNFPIQNGTCQILLTGEESIMDIALEDLVNEYADIASCKTHTIVDNTLFMANTSAYVHKYNLLQKLAWCIFPEQVESEFDLPDAKGENAVGYYQPSNVHYKVGYWPDEYYRFGVVFVYNNNQLSPVFNIQGYDLNLADPSSLKDDLFNKNSTTGKFEFWDAEPDDYIFKDYIQSNARGVTKLRPISSGTLITGTGGGTGSSRQISINFNLSGLSTWIEHTQDLTDVEKQQYYDNIKKQYDFKTFLREYHGIKGLFFVRQKRIPTTIAQGIVVGLTTKDHGSIPVLKNGNVWETKSFLSPDRMIYPIGSTVKIIKDKKYFQEDDPLVVTKALLVPDAELQEATFNQIFTSAEFTLLKEGTLNFNVYNNDVWRYESFSPATRTASLATLTAVPKDTKLKTNGSDFFSTIAGSAEESYKTVDVVFNWSKTPPQHLTNSTSLIRGKWGYYVGMGYDEGTSFSFGDVVSIKKAGFYKDSDAQNVLEFQHRFHDNSFYSPISFRLNIDDLEESGMQCFNGDCFPSLFTHRMMSNFIDPELPTNTTIINPACWAKNYAVRCTAEILAKTHSNLTSDSSGFFVPSPVSNKSNVVSLIFGILSGNLGIIISSIQDMTSNEEVETQTDFANEVAQAFEVYTGIPSSSSESYSLELEKDPITSGGYTEYNTPAASSAYDSLRQAVQEGKIKVVKPKEQEQDASGLNLKALFKSDDKWDLHGVAQINRADVNAVSFGQWISFPIMSSMNLALRDIDFNNTTEEAKFNQKRSFYPLEPMDISNKLHESNVINGAAKKTVYKNTIPVYKTVPFYKQEHFNRIYWSKPNSADSFLNSFRMVYKDQYKEYNKEFGDITKIMPLNNSLFVCFDHGMGTLPIDRSIKTATEASPYLSSRNVLTPQVQTLSKDFGSMWKNSIIQSPKGLIYGVDTVGKKIWRTDGQQVEFISDHKVTKFLNDFIPLSEFDFKAYQGHLDVKTHYNNFKNDVIFTLVKDIPTYATPNKDKVEEIRLYLQQMWCSGSNDLVYFGPYKPSSTSPGNGTMSVVYGTFVTTVLKNNQETISINDIDLNNFSQCVIDEAQATTTLTIGADTYTIPEIFTEKTVEIQSGKVYINDIFTGVWLDIEKWEPGTIWSLCFNEILNKFTTFYDWYPIDSCNVNNVYFSFDQEQVDTIYNNTSSTILYPDIEYYKKISGSWYKQSIQKMTTNKYFIDKAFTEQVDLYKIDPGCRLKVSNSGKEYISFYYKGSDPQVAGSGPLNQEVVYPVEDGWVFTVYKSGVQNVYIENTSTSDYISIVQIKSFDSFEEPKASEKEHLKYYKMRDYNPNRMHLWKHGQAGLYDNEGKVMPTYWYGQQHEFNFEFVVNEAPIRQKVFNNLKILSNKTAPSKFEFEIVGEGYEWMEFKPIVEWIHYMSAKEPATNWWEFVLNQTSSSIHAAGYKDFPSLLDESRVITKLPYLQMRLTDKKGTPERPHYKWDGGVDYWTFYSSIKNQDNYSYNCSEPCLVEDSQLNEVRVRTEQLGNNVRKYGRVRGNMEYLEDLWDVEIRPIKFQWIYKDSNNTLQRKDNKETKHRDKYIKVRVRYSGEDLALIQQIYTIFDESYA